MLTACSVPLLLLAACSNVDVPAEPEVRAVAAIQQESSTTVRRRLPPDHDRARTANEAVRSFEIAHPHEPPQTRIAETVVSGSEEGGIPDQRFLEDPVLALGSGHLVADITFLNAGEPDDFALEETGRFRVQTTRYRVRLNAVVRRNGDALPAQEFDLFTERRFRPVAAAAGEPPRMLAVLGDRFLRPGFNLKIAVPLSERGFLQDRAYGAEIGAFTADLFRDLRSHAARLPRRAGGVS